MQQRLPPGASVLLALLLPASAAAASAAGCRIVSQPVCGLDGNTYQNRCIAERQGVTVIARGACTAQAVAAAAAAAEPQAAAAAVGPAAEALFAAAASVVQGFAHSPGSGSITQQMLDRYSHEGMVLVGWARPVGEAFRPRPPSTSTEQTAPPNYAAAAAAVAAITPDGCIYRSRGQVLLAQPAAEAAAAAGQAAPQPLPLEPAAASTSVDVGVGDAGGDGDGGESDTTLARKLAAVFGADDRQQITGQRRMPFSAVGLVSYLLPPSGPTSLCTGAMIGKQTAVSAAHCYLGDARGQVTSTWTISPHYTSAGLDQRFGRASAVRAFFNTNYWSNWQVWDIVVVVLDQPLGSKTGVFSLPTGTAPYSGPLETAGYAGDRSPFGLYWIPETKCRVNDVNGADSELPHTCDTFEGQSGSPMWSNVRTNGRITGRRLQGVHSNTRSSGNYAMALNAYWTGFLRQYKDLSS